LFKFGEGWITGFAHGDKFLAPNKIIVSRNPRTYTLHVLNLVFSCTHLSLDCLQSNFVRCSMEVGFFSGSKLCKIWGFYFYFLEFFIFLLVMGFQWCFSLIQRVALKSTKLYIPLCIKFQIWISISPSLCLTS